MKIHGIEIKLTVGETTCTVNDPNAITWSDAVELFTQALKGAGYILGTGRLEMIDEDAGEEDSW